MGKGYRVAVERDIFSGEQNAISGVQEKSLFPLPHISKIQVPVSSLI